MLTPELVRARKRSGELLLTPLSPKQQARALELAEELMALARAHQGRPREELERAEEGILVSPQERKLLLGLNKMTEDACEFSSEPVADAAALRARTFLLASERRAALGPGDVFDREGVLAEIAREFALDPAGLESGLYSDLRGAQLLLQAPRFSAAELVLRYEHAQRQAVLLRAVKVVAEVRCASPSHYRLLFQRLKFRRLLFAIERLPNDGYRIAIDGPFSLFESVTKYGLALALMLPALEACDSLSLEAQIHWGKQREPLLFRLRTSSAEEHGGEAPPALPDETAALCRALEALGSPYKIKPSQAILELPGIGLCIPDLEFEHSETGEIAYLEVLGYWSRDAVWRRVELATQGLGERVLFAVSSRLRVSQDVLDDQELAALYVYKGTMNARAVLDRVEELRKRKALPKARAGGGAKGRARS